MAGASSRTGKLEVVASDQTFSSRFDGGRARIGPSVWSSVSASKSALVSAAAFRSNARCQLTFALAVSQDGL